MNWKCLGANWKQVCNKYQFCLFRDPLIPIPMFNEGETESSLLEPRLLSFALSGWPGGGDVTEPSCYLGDGSRWVVGFFFIFLMGTGELFGQLGIGYGKNIAYSFTAEHGFYTSWICPSQEKHSWFLVCIYFGIEPTVPDSVFCHFAHTAPCLPVLWAA